MTALGKNDSITRNIAIFDLDHTISKRDTYLQFLLAFLSTHPLHIFRCIFLPVAVLLHKFHFRDNSWLKETFLTAIAGGSKKDRIHAFSKKFVERLLHSGLYASAQERIKQHRTNNDYLVLSSASFDFYVNPLAQQLGFDAVVCTRAEWDETERLTGRIAGNNCYGEFKKTATEKAISLLGDCGQITVYSDHHSDVPVFSLANHAVAVNPTEKLRKFAALNNFMVERWG